MKVIGFILDVPDDEDEEEMFTDRMNDTTEELERRSVPFACGEDDGKFFIFMNERDLEIDAVADKLCLQISDAVTVNLEDYPLDHDGLSNNLSL